VKLRKGLDVKERGITIISGATRKNSTNPQIVR
jgi:hypothetical protein